MNNAYHSSRLPIYEEQKDNDGQKQEITSGFLAKDIDVWNLYYLDKQEQPVCGGVRTAFQGPGQKQTFKCLPASFEQEQAMHQVILRFSTSKSQREVEKNFRTFRDNMQKYLIDKNY